MPRALWGACLILDARYEKVREHGVIRSQAVLIAIGIGWDGRRHILGVELANRESRGGWRDTTQTLLHNLTHTAPGGRINWPAERQSG